MRVRFLNRAKLRFTKTYSGYVNLASEKHQVLNRIKKSSLLLLSKILPYFRRFQYSFPVSNIFNECQKEQIS